MGYGPVLVFVLASFAGRGAVLDRIAVIVGATEGTQRSIIKDSDIDRDIRFTSFLNGERLDLSNAARKKATDRLIDQIFIRREIEMGDYATATVQEADQQLDKLEKQRFRTEAAFREELHKYGLTEEDLRFYFQWQLTILRFIDLRFKPAVMVSDEDVQKYYQDHRAALSRAHPGKSSLNDLREEIRGIVTGEKVNEQFFAWLNEQRKNSKIQFREESLG